MTDAIARQLASVAEGEVRFGRHDRMLYATDASIYQVEPLGVFVPRSVADGVRAVRFCAEHGLAVLPRGGGTSLAGQAVGRAVVIDFSAHCRGIRALDAAARQAVVEPGVVLDQLNREAAAAGLTFGPDVATSSHATLGGMIGNNSSGAHSILYGRTVEHLLAADVTLADGTTVSLARGAAAADPRVEALGRGVAEIVRPLGEEIRRRYPKTLRRVSGYNLDLMLDQLERSPHGGLDELNLAHLICGSEGTLGVLGAATVRLVELPKRKALAIAAFATLDDALHALGAILETQPAAVELLDDVIIGLARANVECRRYLELLPARGDAAPGAVLYVEYFADDAAALEARLEDLRGRLEGVPLRSHTDAGAMQRAWQLRKSGEPLLHGIPGARKPLAFVEDTAVDPARLPEFVTAFRRIVEGHGTTAAWYAHASVGCLHVRPLVCLRDERDRAAMEAIASEVAELVRSCEGAVSAEHGDGRVRSHLLRRFYGEPICDAFRRIKALFDPQGRLNPGVIVDPPPMMTALRVKPAETVLELPQVRTFYRYEAEEGFGHAVELCNGAGVCRRLRGGTMCPSYRALRDERHATRGRGNALRLAITGQLDGRGGGPVWDDPDVIETLDLCLSCKACKAECPSNVDLARLKAEYTAQRYAAAGRVPRRVRRFGRVRGAHRAGSALWPVAEAVRRIPPAALVAKKLLGIDPRRSLPGFGPSLYRWHRRRRRAPGGGPAVVLLPDCFSVYGEPRVGRAAVGVLERLGYRVVLPGTGCCGRALISSGMLEEARGVCRATAQALLDCTRAHDAPLVGCEPSCVSAIKDDWLDLDLGLDPAALRGLAERTSLVEEFVEARFDAHPRPPRPAAWPGAAPVLLHGHCHQKALWGIDSSAALLRRLLGERLVELDSGCCGMAGAFGYTPQHYELSMAIGELELFGALRAERDATVVAPGTSCRHQIADGTGRRAIHPIELADACLE